MAVELTISVKGEDSTYKQKFLVYEDFKMKHDDRLLKKLIKEAMENAKIEPEDIKVRAMIQVL